jgi:membrane-associated protease RseP (regulator of RpoE activity)
VTTIPFVIGSGVFCMLAHEVGHLVAARICGVAASELSLGLGPRICGVRLRGMTFNLRAFPVGSFVLLDGTTLRARPMPQQLFVHLGGVAANTLLFVLTFGTIMGWLNLVLAVSNLLPIYKQDGWKCGVLLMRRVFNGSTVQVERAFTLSGGLVSLAFLGVILLRFVK